MVCSEPWHYPVHTFHSSAFYVPTKPLVHLIPVSRISPVKGNISFKCNTQLYFSLSLTLSSFTLPSSLSLASSFTLSGCIQASSDRWGSGESHLYSCSHVYSCLGWAGLGCAVLTSVFSSPQTSAQVSQPVTVPYVTQCICTRSRFTVLTTQADIHNDRSNSECTDLFGPVKAICAVLRCMQYVTQIKAGVNGINIMK